MLCSDGFKFVLQSKTAQNYCVPFMMLSLEHVKRPNGVFNKTKQKFGKTFLNKIALDIPCTIRLWQSPLFLMRASLQLNMGAKNPVVAKHHV